MKVVIKGIGSQDEYIFLRPIKLNHYFCTWANILLQYLASIVKKENRNKVSACFYDFKSKQL